MRHTHRVLLNESHVWFRSISTTCSGKSSSIVLRHETIVREMLLPRCIFSPSDALYCAKFCELVHSLDTPGFYTILHYSARGMRSMIRFSLLFTEIESKNFAMFFRESMNTMLRWIKDRDFFFHDTRNKVGWVKKWLNKKTGNIIHSTLSENVLEKNLKINYTDFCKLYIKQFTMGLRNFSFRSLSSHIISI